MNLAVYSKKYLLQKLLFCMFRWQPGSKQFEC